MIGPSLTRETSIWAPKTPRCDLRPERRQTGTERLIQRLRHRARRRRGPRWPPTFAGVGVQRELAHDEHRCAEIGRGPLVGHDPQLPDLAGQASPPCVGVVVVGDAQQDEESWLVDRADDLRRRR